MELDWNYMYHGYNLWFLLARSCYNFGSLFSSMWFDAHGMEAMNNVSPRHATYRLITHWNNHEIHLAQELTHKLMYTLQIS